MKALTDRLEWLRLSIVDEKTGITDPHARQMALDMWIEANAIAEVLPEITVTLPTPPPGQRRVPQRIIDIRPPHDEVVNGGRSSGI